jgi:hypothetical protein
MSKQTGTLVRVTWVEHDEYAAREATLEVEHADGSMTFLVVPVDRQSGRIPKKRRKQEQP